MHSKSFDFPTLLNRQEDIQRVFHKGPSPVELDPQRKMAFIMETGFALVHEIVEATAETGWKPWASSNYINSDAYRGELADVFIFLMNAMLIDGMSMEDLWRLVERKQQVNLDRQRNGYDGVSTKCPACKRAYDDPAATCRQAPPMPNNQPTTIFGWCGVYGYVDKDGVQTDACPGCGDGYEVPGTKCLPPRSLPPHVMAWCDRKNGHYDSQGNPA